ncbi:MAG: hypothetical protein A2079_07420 [Geobacteraceae bacterium GWC2_48_7]|nr:MAG: hypothetical protein A2079_07420 [Geobacteraceae bacterium GWC2_48_7]
MFKKQSLLFVLGLVFFGASLTVSASNAAEPSQPAKATIAKICTNCHKAEANVVRGYFENVAFKSKTIQMKIDDDVVLVKFDEDDVKVVNGAGKAGDGELLRKIPKGHEIKIAYVEKDGVKMAVKVDEKPPVKLPENMLISTTEVEKLVAQGPEKGKYFLFDSRPLPRFQEGSIPTAVNLPFPAFDKLVGKLPKEKDALVIFYCAGPSCNMSPGSATKAQKLGYTNIKVYVDGMPAWSQNNYGVLSVQFLKEAWIGKDIPHVLLDARDVKESGKGFIKGAVAFPAANADKLVKGLGDLKKKAPIMVYDAKDGKQAEKVAKALIKAKYTNVKIIPGGIDAWKTAGYETATGKLVAKATYVPKPRPGEMSVDEFKKIAAAIPANVMIIDVRNADEVKSGMIKGAKQISAEELKEHAAEISKDKMIITHCATGVRAEMGYHTLKEMGYTNVKFLNANMEFDKKGAFKISKD